MNKITMHVPGFARDLYLNDKWEYEIPFEHFETLEELLNVSFVRRHSEDKTFTQYAKNQDDGLLIAMRRDNTEQWVIGKVQDSEVLTPLPEWRSVRVEK